MTSTKDDQDKPKMKLITPGFMFALANVLTLGNAKYPGKRDWRYCEAPSDYFSAAMRHMMSWHSGESYDKETGISHLIHATACMMIIFELHVRGVDDRERVEG